MFGLFGSKKQLKPQPPAVEFPVFSLNRLPVSYSLDLPICAFGRFDSFTLDDATQGVQIFGAVGSGKTTGSGQFLADSFLSNGFGGLILTVKKDERSLWVEYCKKTGRELVIFAPQNGWKFNFLDYELNRGGQGGGQTENIVDLFLTVLELEAGSHNRNEAYWQNALKQLLRNTIDLLKISKGTLTMWELYKVITTAPQNAQDVRTIEGQDGRSEESEWMKNSFCADLLFEASNKEGLSEIDKQDLEIVRDYWLKEFPNIADKTRSIIVSSFTSLADMFLRGHLREMFCTETNIFPEVTHEGVLILVDLPVHEYGKIGQYAQAVIKYVWQKATERREPEKDLKPVFLWADEAQFFVNSHDVKFQTTARSCRACTVYLTQNLPNYLNIIGDNLTYSLLGNLQTKIFHQNTDPKTNQYASDVIGKDWKNKMSTSIGGTEGEDWEGVRQNRGSSLTKEMQYTLPPVEFTKLKKGGKANGFIVDGVVYKSGKLFESNGENHLTVSFRQLD